MSTISASTTSTTAYKVTADTTGVLTLQTGATPTTAMTIDTSQRVGIGTASPNVSLHIENSSSVIKTFSSGNNAAYTVYQSNGNGKLLYVGQDNSTGASFGVGGYSSVIWNDGAYPIVFATNNAERARIDSSGNLLVGATALTQNASYMGFSPANGFADFGHINGSVSGLEYLKFLYNGSKIGSITQNGTTAVAYNTSSDYRLKHDIAPMTGALARVAALKPVTYKWNADDSDGEGFIAHELAEVCPHAVTGEKDATRIEQYEISPAVPATFDEEGNELTPAVEAVMGEREVPVYQGIDTSFLVATLVAAIQELNAKITALENK